MHLLIPFASGASEGGRDALSGLQLPRLATLLARSKPQAADAGDASSLSPPHERALARELGFVGADGLLPWGAHLAARDGIDTGDRAWGLLSPTHWQVGSDRITLADPDALALDEPTSRALFAAVVSLFEGDGCTLAYGAATRWYAAHPSLAALPTASLDRVIGRNVDRWLPAAPAARSLRRLQSEVQMLLHAHPLNEAREAGGQWPVNSFWLSGCGMRQPARDASDLVVLDALRRPALAEDWRGWRDAWQALDAGALRDAAERAEPVALTLCGERSARRFDAPPGGWWSRVASRLRGDDTVQILQTL
jgi:hypothetical protein